MEGKRLEDYKKINKWIEVHWKIVLGLIIFIAPIGIYFLSLQYSIGTKKELSADYIFSGLTTYVGVIISICGIYWQVTRTERKERLEKEHLINNQWDNINKMFLFNYSEILDKFSKSSEEKELDVTCTLNYVASMKLKVPKIIGEFFLLLDEDVVKENKQLIINKDENYEMLKIEKVKRDVNLMINEYFSNELLSEYLSLFNKIKYENHSDEEEKLYQILLIEIETIKLILNCSFFTKDSIKFNSDWVLELIEELFIEETELSISYKELFYKNDEINTHSDSLIQQYEDRISFFYLLLNKCFKHEIFRNENSEIDMFIKNNRKIFTEILDVLSIEISNTYIMRDNIGKLVIILNEKHQKILQMYLDKYY